MRQLKPKICKQCKTEYNPRAALQAVCGLECAIDQSNAKKAKRDKAEIKKAQQKERVSVMVRKNKLKTRSQWLKEAQAEFNKYIRARDKGLPCISSGVMEKDRFTGGYFDAGHYRSRGSASHLRFNTYNCHAQAKRDNRELSGNIVEYRKGLIERIGLERVERLENDNTPRKFDIEYLRRVKTIFSRRAKLTLKRQGLSNE